MNEHIRKHVSPDALIAAILARPETPRSLATKLTKNRRIGKHSVRLLAKIAERAVFDIVTLHGYVVNEQLEPNNGGLVFRIAATVLPWAKDKDESKQYLCMYTDRTLPQLQCKLAVIRLTIDGDARTVLVPDHVCDRLGERAGVKGSHVAFVAKSVHRSGIRTRIQKNKRELLLEIIDFDGDIIGYCPISEKHCALAKERNTLVNDVADLVREQDRWRLKTFLLPEYVHRNLMG